MVMEPKYLAFRRWLYTPIIIWEGDWILRVSKTNNKKTPENGWLAVGRLSPFILGRELFVSGRKNPPFPQGGPLTSYMYRPAYTTPIDGRKFVGLRSFHPKISGIYVVVSNLGLLFSSRNLREMIPIFDKQRICFRWVGSTSNYPLVN